MKKFITATLFCFYATIANCQITLEKTYNEIVSLMRLSENEFYYVNSDYNNYRIRIYSLSHNLEKTITVPSKSGFKLSSISNISKGLFNTDGDIEYLALYLDVNSNKQKIFIFKENGTELFSEELSYYFGGVQNTLDNGTKLFTRKQDYNSSTQTFTNITKVYSLTGKVLSIKKPAAKDDDEITAYPNPTTGFIALKYKLPNNAFAGMLVISDISGRVIERIPVSNNGTQYSLDASGYKPGTYLFYTEGAGGISPVEQFIVQQ